MTRRRLLGVALGGIALVMVGCGDSSPESVSGAWSFTDDRGVTVSLESQPERIVAYDLAAAALMNVGVKCVGIFASLPLAENSHLSGLDLSGVETVSSAYGQVNMETLAGLRPDVIITIFDPRLTGPVIGFKDTAMQTSAEQIAPIIAINSVREVTEVIDRFEELSTALGVDLTAPEVTAAHEHFSTASARLQAATAAKPGLTAVAAAAYEGRGISFAWPDANPTLRLYQRLGLTMVKPTSEQGDINKQYDSYFYERNSFELADKYPADLIMYTNRPGSMTLTALNEIPTWKARPAVTAGQFFSWRVTDPFSYKVLADDVEALAKAVEGAKVVTQAG